VRIAVVAVAQIAAAGPVEVVRTDELVVADVARAVAVGIAAAEWVVAAVPERTGPALHCRRSERD